MTAGDTGGSGHSGAAARADAALAGQVASPDASLTADDGLIATSAAGLTYPWGKAAPGKGELLQVSESVHWARIPMPGSLGHINSWLIEDGDDAVPAYVAVDTGLMLQDCSDAWKALFAGALADKRLSRVVCTHLHPDHIGLAGWLAKRFSAPILMTRGEWLQARYMIADVRDEQPAEVTVMQRGCGWDDEAIEAAKAAGWSRFGRMVARLPFGYQRLIDGQRLSIGKGEWRIVTGSGHSPEHACLLNEAEGVLISGDQVLPRISSNVSSNAGEPDANPLGEWLASIDKLLRLPADLLVCPAHGEPFRGLHTRLIALRDEHHERLDAVAAALAEAPRRVIDCFGLLFRREIGADHIGLATGETLAHLRYLEQAGRVRREDRDGVWWWTAA
ncbi:MBL fold metallo-hydrolase [Sphingomonas lacunae]|uniref:MBL fold metallo-hydrolase n=1 Tax=Sphingomonas lacunae TaxID=2698828 RepID=A0A6M4AVZ2_9SPHN|nr:MBL fold metallo-hydrolase [Sphingomonas lacunae]QJQ32189.1 MBL fold metallo-hydrolase [Sphingomonas lacunae]